MSEARPPRVVVLGGGSAGWMTACLLHHRWAARGGHITVVESPAIGIIGVGEGSTPQLKAFFDLLGIAEADWMAACDATYKLGIRFTGWSEVPGFDSYFHPFPSPIDLHTEPGFVHNCALRRRGGNVPAHPDDWFLGCRLAMSGKSPHPVDTFPFAPSYGYHFDSFKLGHYLRDWATSRGVAHRPLRVDEIEMTGTGDVAALLCEDGTRIDGDLFVDCSGFASVIAQQKLGAQFLSYDAALFNDRAVVMPMPHQAPALPQTDAVAMRAGWRWSIPLTSRVGNGYVYASRHLSDEDAAAELLTAIGVSDDEAEPRFLQMKVGRVENSWIRNCLAVGLSQGFVEPLEATALHIVIHTALDFAEACESGGYSDRHRDTFNARIAQRYDGIRDYIVAHYRMNRRSDTDYWRENAANDSIPDNLKAMMTAWFTHSDIARANREIYGTHPAYAPMSWHALFAGYGSFPPADRLQALPNGLHSADLDETAHLLQRCAANFPDYRMT